MFSVIIPLYNKALYVEKAIQSVLAQTYKEFELIVVNDGSTDNSLEVVKNCQLSTVNCQLIDQSNSGVSTTRNNGVKVAKYDYICFLDADDWWTPTFLEEMRSLILDFPDAGIYGSSYFYVKNGYSRTVNIGVDKDFIRGYINYCAVYAKTLAMPLWTGATIIPKKVFVDMNGFKPTLKLGEDFDLWIRITLKKKVVFLNKPLAFYNQDVELKNRAVGKLHNPATHMLWNLDYLKEEEKHNNDLKLLLDNLRTYSLLPYYLSKQYNDAAKLELQKVDWSKQSRKTLRIYNTPRFLVKCQYEFMKMGARLKQWLLKIL